MFRREFVRDKTFEAHLFDRFNDRRIVKLLLVVKVVSTRISRCVEMPDAVECATNIVDHVALHAAHVINVVEQLHAIAVNAVNEIDTPLNGVGHVIPVIFRVQQFKADVHLVGFR